MIGFESYLSDRRMYVRVNDTDSQVKTINIGLPQGAVTSPYLFSLYINDMHRCSDRLSFLHFADDTTVYMSGSDLDQLCVDASVELRNVDESKQIVVECGEKVFYVVHSCSGGSQYN